MNLITVGTYPFFIRRVVHDMDIRPDDAILDLGAGTGRNACLMRRYLSERGRIVGLDIGPEMLAQAQRRCRRFANITFEKRRVEEPLPYGEEFDKVFISFVLHGFIQEDRLRIIANARRALRPGGHFLILDYNEFDLARSPWPVRFAFRLPSGALNAPWPAISCAVTGGRFCRSRALETFRPIVTTSATCDCWRRARCCWRSSLGGLKTLLGE